MAFFSGLKSGLKNIIKPNKSKVLITGGGGQIADSLMHLMASGRVFGLDTKVELRLLEIEAALSGLDGIKMELQDCAYPLLNEVICTSDLETAFEEVNWVCLLGGHPRKEGMTRLDLLEVNAPIIIEQAIAVNKYAADTIKGVMGVANPCNTLMDLASRYAPNIPPECFHALMQLDANRATAFLAEKAGVSVECVKNVAILGNHSESVYPCVNRATIKGKPVKEVIDEKWLQNEFIKKVQERGKEIINKKGRSSAPSVAKAIRDAIKNLLKETSFSEQLSCHDFATGEYRKDTPEFFSTATKYPMDCIATQYSGESVFFSAPYI